MIEVIKPGLLDLVMDLGRPGFRMQGVPEGGAADTPSFLRANRLVGNPDNAAGLEMIWRGAELRFVDAAVVAFSGADMGVSATGYVLPPNRRHVLPAGTRLKFGQAVAGLRAYLAVAGGIDVPMLLGSRSTFLPGGWGGWCGRALEAGDSLPIGRPPQNDGWNVLSPPIPGRSIVLRVLPGPQIGGFADSALADLFARSFRVHADSNRLGIRLTGPRLEYPHRAPLASQAVLPGAIQVPASGQPIILGWDGPVTGGYPVIAGVIAADLAKVAQLGPGDELSFRAVSPTEACEAWRQASIWMA